MMLTPRPLDDVALATLFEDVRGRRVNVVDEATFRDPPKGFRRNHGHAVVGSGDVDFEIARELMRNWEHFPRGWVTATYDGPTEVGQQVAVCAHLFGLCVTNVCRVTDVVEHHSADWSTWSVTYSTISGHDMTGAERFQLSWDKTTDVVSYEITSYSRPKSWLARVLWFYVRSLQRRFVEESCQRVAMLVTQRRPHAIAMSF